MEERVITVTETASEKLPADYVNISLTACAEGKNYADASDKADALAAKATNTLAAIGVEVRTSGINVTAVRDGKKITGYRAARSFSAGFDYDKKTLSGCLEAISATECEWRLSFSLRDKSASKRVTEQAVVAARESADTIARAAGVKLGKLVKVDYASQGGGRVAFMRAAAVGGAVQEPEDITVSETVTCSFEII